MSFAKIAGIPVSRGVLRLPLVGTWEAELTTTDTSATKLTGRVSLEVAGASWSGTVLRAEADAGSLVTVRMVGGSGGLATELAPRAYRSATRRVILDDVLTQAGESLGLGSDEAFLAASVPRWTRQRGTVGEAIKGLLAGTGYSWRIGADGSMVVAAESWPEVEPTHVVESEDPTRDELVVALDSIAVLPGLTFLGRRISSATYAWDDRRLRAELCYDPDGRAGPAAELARFIRREVAQSSLHKPLAGRVLAQYADGSVDVRTFDPTMPDLPRVPLRLGLPGIASVVVPVGTEVVLMHADGGPQRPVVVGFAPGSSTSIVIDSPVQVGGDESLALATPVEVHAASVNATIIALAGAVATFVPTAAPAVSSALGLLYPLVGAATTRTKGA